MKLPHQNRSINLKEKLHGNKNAERKTRKIELGWMNYQDSMYKQVRKPTGGGTRELVVSKEQFPAFWKRGKPFFSPMVHQQKEK